MSPGPSPASPRGDRAALIEGEVARRLADRCLLSSLTSFIGYMFQALVIRHYATQEYVVGWVAALVACDLFCGVVAFESLRRYKRSDASPSYANWQAVAMTLLGTVWGCSAFFPGIRDQSLLFVVNLSILSVIGVFAIHNLCLHRPSLSGFALGLIAPSMFSSAFDPESWPLRVGAAAVVLVMIHVYASKSRRLERREISHKIALEDMTHQLTRKNDELAEALQAIDGMASQDPLTECMNRRGLHQRYRHAATRPGGQSEALGIVMIDADHFKKINDAHGHDTGDQVLCMLARRVKSQLRTPDGLARWGGEEFLCVVEGADATGLMAVAERIRLAVCEQPMVCKTATLTVTVSLGVSLLRKHEAFEAAVDRADKALYQAKHSGRNCVGALGDPLNALAA